MSAKLAGIAYEQDWRHLIACASTEGFRPGAERHARLVTRVNHEGSGAGGPFQFMPGTWASTPQGQAGLSRFDVEASFHAAAWMWARGRRNEWTGVGC